MTEKLNHRGTWIRDTTAERNTRMTRRKSLNRPRHVVGGLAVMACLALTPGSAHAQFLQFWTVCASGCSFESLSQAVADPHVQPGDQVEVMPDKIYTEQVTVGKRLDIFAPPDGTRPVITWAGDSATTFAITPAGAGTTLTHLDIRSTGPGVVAAALDAAGSLNASDLTLTSTSGYGAVLQGSGSQLGPDITATVTANGVGVNALPGTVVTGLTLNANVPGSLGVELQPEAVLTDSTVNADIALQTFGGTTRRATLNGAKTGVRAEPAAKPSVVSDSVATSTADGGQAVLVTVSGSTQPAALTLRNVTAVAGGVGSSGLEAPAFAGLAGGSPGSIDARNVIARGAGADLQADPVLSPCLAGLVCKAARVEVGYSNFLSTSGVVDTETLGHNQHASPMLVNPVVGADQDFHIADARSPLIGAGTLDPSSGKIDRDGIPHPNPPSIGAYESLAPRPTPDGGPLPGSAPPPGSRPANGGSPAIGGAGAPPATKPTISLLRETNTVFVVGPSSTPLTAQTARSHKRGTVFSFHLDQPATVKLAIQTTTPGRRVDRRCTPDSLSRRSKPRCQHTTTIATLTRSGHAGRNQVAFSGRIHHKALKPGRYLASLTATDDAGTSRVETIRFTIVKHRRPRPAERKRSGSSGRSLNRPM